MSPPRTVRSRGGGHGTRNVPEQSLADVGDVAHQSDVGFVGLIHVSRAQVDVNERLSHRMLPRVRRHTVEVRPQGADEVGRSEDLDRAGRQVTPRDAEPSVVVLGKHALALVGGQNGRVERFREVPHDARTVGGPPRPPPAYTSGRSAFARRADASSSPAESEYEYPSREQSTSTELASAAGISDGIPNGSVRLREGRLNPSRPFRGVRAPTRR